MLQTDVYMHKLNITTLQNVEEVGGGCLYLYFFTFNRYLQGSKTTQLDDGIVSNIYNIEGPGVA
jgi:hypothetical protein